MDEVVMLPQYIVKSYKDLLMNVKVTFIRYSDHLKKNSDLLPSTRSCFLSFFHIRFFFSPLLGGGDWYLNSHWSTTP